jgi:RNA polymerase sigma factor (TIGR02999 family)
MGEITLLLDSARSGSPEARQALFSTIYAELQKLARSRLAQESTLTELDAPSLVHELYLRLDRQAQLPGRNRRMFFAYASTVMRSVIVDHVRERRALKRGSAEKPVTLLTRETDGSLRDPDIEALDFALRQLERVDERAHQIVEMRYFGGLSLDEIAAALELSPVTVWRDWEKARVFLYKALQE